MFRRPSARQLFIQRVIVYAVMTLSVLVIVAGAILFTLGYRLDSANGRLEQGALIQFDSQPGGATVSIDGKTLLGRTATKQTVVAGTHSFMMTRDGYQPWEKTVDITAGTLTWFDYVRLVPTTLTPESVSSFASIVDAKTSPDRKKMIIQEKRDTPTFQIVDISSDTTRTTTVTLPADDYSGAGASDVTHAFAVQSWDQNGRHVLIKHNYNDSVEWIVLDVENAAASVNITTALNISLRTASFVGTSGNLLFGLSTEGIIRKLDLSAQTISRGLVTNVRSFELYKTDIISYVGVDPNNKDKTVVGIYKDGDDAPRVLASTTLDVPLGITTTRYLNDDYVAIAKGLQVDVLRGRLPASNDLDNSSLEAVGEFTVADEIDAMSFSTEGDFLVVQSGLNLTSFELDHLRTTEGVVATSEAAPHELRWLDEAYLWSVYDGHVSIREFDGTNVHVLNVAEPSFDIALTENGRYLYSITKTENVYQLQRIKMIID